MPAPLDDPRANAHRSGYTHAGFAARYDTYRVWSKYSSSLALRVMQKAAEPF